MNRKELIADIAARTDFSKKDVTEILDAYEKSIIDALRRGENVQLHGFMNIEHGVRKGHKGRDFNKGVMIDIQDQPIIKVRPGTMLAACLET
jgi:DNA-binding protein HU-beta